jgi:hypothetical protein
MAKTTGRTAPCGWAEALTRLRQAEAFVLTAELCLSEADDPDLPLAGTGAALAVLGAIAAADAACCANLGRRSRGQDHRQAVELVAGVQPGGAALAKDLERLLEIKDKVHYGAVVVGHAEAKASVAQARRMVSLVSELLQ